MGEMEGPFRDGYTGGQPLVRVPRPRTHYAKSGDIHIAYQVMGEGPDLLFSSGIFSNIEVAWELPAWRYFFERLASFSRLIVLDLRGIGLSDRGEPPYLEMQLDDFAAVMDAVGSERFGADSPGKR